MYDYLIIGNGISGLSAAEEIRKNDENGSILIITDEDGHTYWRTRLSELIAKDYTDEEILVKKDTWYEEKNIEEKFNTYAEKIDKENIQNLKEMNESDMGQPYDLNNDYTVPYMNGTIGIIYNKDLVSEKVDSWDIMWNEKYKKQIFVLDAQRDAIGMALKKLGYSLNTTNEKELEEAKNLLIEQKPLVLKYGADEVKDLMTSGEASIAMIWSGEGLTLADENENLEYVIPKEGANYWLDSWAIPANANDKETAEKFINFVSGKDNAYKIAEEIGYTTPNKLAMEEQPEEVKNNEGAYMPKEIMEKCEVYKYLPQEKLRLYEDVWSAVKAAN